MSLTDLKRSIEAMTVEEQLQVYRIVQLHKVDHQETATGVILNLNDTSDTCRKHIVEYIDLLNKERALAQERDKHHIATIAVQRDMSVSVQIAPQPTQAPTQSDIEFVLRNCVPKAFQETPLQKRINRRLRDLNRAHTSFKRFSDESGGSTTAMLAMEDASDDEDEGNEDEEETPVDDIGDDALEVLAIQDDDEPNLQIEPPDDLDPDEQTTGNDEDETMQDDVSCVTDVQQHNVHGALSFPEDTTVAQRMDFYKDLLGKDGFNFGEDTVQSDVRKPSRKTKSPKTNEVGSSSVATVSPTT